MLFSFVSEATRDKLRAFLGLGELMTAVDVVRQDVRNIGNWRLAERADKPEPPPFVSVLAFATMVDSFPRPRPREMSRVMGGFRPMVAPEEDEVVKLSSTTLGTGGVVQARSSGGIPDPTIFTMQTQRPLRDMQVIVFCDLSRVAITGIFCGTNLMTGDVGECPVAYIPEVHPGVIVRVQAELRR